MGDLDLTDNFCRMAAQGSGCAVVPVDYRLAPECKFPGPLEDGYAALNWIADTGDEHGLDGSRIALAGESSGGRWHSGLPDWRGSAKDRMSKKYFLWYPGTGSLGETKSSRLYEGYVIDTPLMRMSIMSYVNDQSEIPNSLVQPIRATDLSEMPPVHLMSAGLDPRHDDNELYADMLAKAGVDIEYHSVDGALHGFLFMLQDHPIGLSPARRSISALGSWAGG